MNLYKATIVSENSCYIHTVLVVAEDKKTANEVLCKQQKRTVKYTRPLTQINMNMSKQAVIEYVGWGESESNTYSDD